ncbi:flagellar hook-basal body complex protein FliE [Nevskia sp.]|uniref:flagellar hook-basal body complex protein FliE n=1 Tax=Nevskia sp. TaxID=1929292 RepID=UPI0025CC3BF9|nr:flagellar hook-basal body complex protein FliE [Nevskia sp.]
MNAIDVNSVLSQIRAMQAQAGNRPAPVAPAETSAAASTGGFGSLLKSSIDSVAKSQNTAADLQKKFELGDPSTDLASVMLATSKSQVSFKAMVEVRNRMVAAYQDIMNMPL